MLLKAHLKKKTRVGVLLLEDSVIALRNPYCPLHDLAQEGIEFYIGKEDAAARNIPTLLGDEQKKYKPKLVSKREAIRLMFEFDNIVNWG
jgi:sulfur relay protein TusB/DsrH